VGERASKPLTANAKLGEQLKNRHFARGPSTKSGVNLLQLRRSKCKKGRSEDKCGGKKKTNKDSDTNTVLGWFCGKLFAVGTPLEQ